jgi:hypothetical protein
MLRIRIPDLASHYLTSDEALIELMRAFYNPDLNY